VGNGNEMQMQKKFEKANENTSLIVTLAEPNHFL